MPAFNLHRSQKGRRRIARVSTALGNSDRVGAWGAYRNVNYDLASTGMHRGNADTAKPAPKVARAAFLPDSVTILRWHVRAAWSIHT